MTFLQSILLGIVEGVTEFLPISSTGHLILASSLLGLVENEFTKSFEIAIQLGAILAVVALYWKKFFDIDLLKKLFVAFLPTGILGLLFYHLVKTYLLGNTLVVLTSLFIGGLVLIGFEAWRAGKDGAVTELSYRQAFLVGLFQSVAMIPGVSRSGATIIGGLALGVSRATIVEFSFFLAVPTMLAATGLDLLKSGLDFTTHEWLLLLVGAAVSFVVALAAIRWLLAYVRRHSFSVFGVYRILLAILFAIFALHL